MTSNLNGPLWDRVRMSIDRLKPGVRVEICPYPKAHKVSFDNLQGYDGCQGVVEMLVGFGGQKKARVIVSSKAKELAGTGFFPVKALKPVSERT